MATCPECRAQFGDDVQTCPEDGSELVASELLLAADPPPVRTDPATRVGRVAGPARRILVVDDNRDGADSMRIMMTATMRATTVNSP